MTATIDDAPGVAIALSLFYRVTEDGRVFSCRTRGGLFVPWKEMTPAKGHHGHLWINIRDGHKKKRKFIHQLVLESFVGPCPKGMECCHEDGNPANNNLSNLRWDTHLANMADRRQHDRNVRGERNASAVLTAGYVRMIRRHYRRGRTHKSLAAQYLVSKQAIQAVCSYKTWRHVSDPLS